MVGPRHLDCVPLSSPHTGPRVNRAGNNNDNSYTNPNPFSLSVETNGESDEAEILGQVA